MVIKTSEIDAFVEAVGAANGDFNAPSVMARFHPFDLSFETQVDQNLDPFSDEYFAQQLALYREISGRELDQSSGELHPIDMTPYLDCPNPDISDEPDVTAESVRATAAMVALSALPKNPLARSRRRRRPQFRDPGFQRMSRPCGRYRSGSRHLRARTGQAAAPAD